MVSARWEASQRIIHAQYRCMAVEMRYSWTDPRFGLHIYCKVQFTSQLLACSFLFLEPTLCERGKRIPQPGPSIGSVFSLSIPHKQGVRSRLQVPHLYWNIGDCLTTSLHQRNEQALKKYQRGVTTMPGVSDFLSNRRFNQLFNWSVTCQNISGMTSGTNSFHAYFGLPEDCQFWYPDLFGTFQAIQPYFNPDIRV